jgi:hypothetical protein
LRRTLAQLAGGAPVLLAVDQVTWGREGMTGVSWSDVLLPVLGYAGAVALGPAAVLLLPYAAPGWGRVFRHGPALGRGVTGTAA